MTAPSIVLGSTSLATTLSGKQNSLTSVGDAADTTSIRVLNGINVRALKAGTNATLSVLHDIVTISGPTLSGKQDSLTSIGDAADTSSIRVLNGTHIRALKAGTNATLSVLNDIVTINGLDSSGKQNTLTAVTTNVPMLNGTTVRALTGSNGVFLSATNDVITIQGPVVSN